MKYNILKQYFNYDSFRGIQEECIDSILNGRDTICVMSTGGGKSITFQVPGLIFEGLTLVISPLISLMNDQVKNLRMKNICAGTLNSNTTPIEEQETLKLLENGKLKFLYLSPERLQNEKYKNILINKIISQITIDEAHCIEWGYDFRPSYLHIKEFIKELKVRPVISCFTATANDEKIKDIQNKLNIKANVYKSSFDRPTLYYETVRCTNKLKYITDFIDKHIDLSGIIYTLTRKNCESLYNTLTKLNYSVSFYHGALSNEEKRINQDYFIKDKKKIMIATSSFGLGIDKPDIRYIINYDLPESIEDLSQQQGRCSRDGKYGVCILLFNEGDLYINEYFINQIENSESLNNEEIKRLKKIKRDKLNDVIKYSTTNKCLHEYLVNYFGQVLPSNCSNCSNCINSYNYTDVYVDAKLILMAVKRYYNHFGINVFSNMLCGIKDDIIRKYNLIYSPFYNKIKGSKDYVKEIISHLINDGYLAKSKVDYPKLICGQFYNDFFKRDEYKVRIYKENNFLNELLNKNTLEEKLLDFRDRKSLRLGYPKYMVLKEDTIKELTRIKPKTKEELLNIKGMGEKNVSKYGDEILELIRKK